MDFALFPVSLSRPEGSAQVPDTVMTNKDKLFESTNQLPY